MATDRMPNGEIIINRNTNNDDIFDPLVDGERKGRGCVPRDYSVQPKEMFQPPKDIKLIPRSEWSARIKEKKELGTQISDIRNTMLAGQPMPALDQNGQGYCWAYSTGSALLMLRALQNQPYVRFSPHAVAWKIKGGKDEGGWGALSLQWAIDKGYPGDKFWPQKSMSREHDNAATWEDAAKHKVSEDWVDLSDDVYSRNLTFDMVGTLLLSNIPIVVDFNWWSHSVCAIDLVEVESNSFGIRILNSWGNAWSENGTGVLQGSKAVPNGATAPRVTHATAA